MSTRPILTTRLYIFEFDSLLEEDRLPLVIQAQTLPEHTSRHFRLDFHFPPATFHPTKHLRPQ